MARYLDEQGTSVLIGQTKALVRSMSSKPMEGATPSSAGTSGLVPQPMADDSNKYLKGDGTWAEIGLDDYATTEDVNKKVDKELGKSLISDDEIARLATVTNYSDTAIKARVKALEDAGYITKIVDDLTNYYKKNEVYTQNEVDTLISTIPKFSIKVVSSLPTSEISNTTIYLLKTSTTESGNLYTEYIHLENSWETLGTQTLDLTDYVTDTALNSELSKYVLSVPGKGLSTNDFNSTYKTKVENSKETFIGTRSEVQSAITDGTIKNGWVVIITDD